MKTTGYFLLPYWGSLSFWQECNQLNNLVAIRNYPYQGLPKGSFNRVYLLSPSKQMIRLSIPILGGRKVDSVVSEIKIDNYSDWKKNHLAVIQSCYGGCLLWEECQDDIRQLYHTHHTFLIDFNFTLFDWLMGLVKLKTNFPQYDSNEQGALFWGGDNVITDFLKSREKYTLSILHTLMYYW